MQKEEKLSLWGDPGRFSPGTSAVMADRQIKRGMENGKVDLEKGMGDEKTAVTFRPTGKWFLMSGGWGNDQVPTAMMGAACGDVAGSVYERHNAWSFPDKDHLIRFDAHFTDDTVMTCAVAEGLRMGLLDLPQDWESVPEAEAVLHRAVRAAMRFYGKRYPDAGYGRGFRNWLKSSHPKPYGSKGNGSAMRVSYAGWVARSLEEAEKLAEITAKVTHNHPESITGARVVAGCIFLLRNGASKEEVARYAGHAYDMNFSLKEIRENYTFDVTCAGTVPVAIRAFLEGESFTDVIAKAIYVGGDSDTIAAIAGSIAEVIYPIPQGLRGRVIDRMDRFLLSSIVEAVDFAWGRGSDSL